MGRNRRCRRLRHIRRHGRCGRLGGCFCTAGGRLLRRFRRGFFFQLILPVIRVFDLDDLRTVIRVVYGVNTDVFQSVGVVPDARVERSARKPRQAMVVDVHGFNAADAVRGFNAEHIAADACADTRHFGVETDDVCAFGVDVACQIGDGNIDGAVFTDFDVIGVRGFAAVHQRRPFGACRHQDA